MRLCARGWLIVSLTSANVRAVSAGNYPLAFVIGFAISCVWWTNSQSAAHTNDPVARWCYALGAGLGTVTGILATMRV